MRKILLILAAIAALGAPAIFADVLEIPVAPVTLSSPTRGMSMSSVLAKYGEPVLRHAPAGGESPRRPPITRWDYAEFSVFFEKSTVIDTVFPDAPAPIANTSGLIEP